MMPVDIEPQPRIDTLLTVRASGCRRRTSRSSFPTASFVDDPSGTPAWVNLRVLAHGGWPFGFTYRVVALTAVDAAE